MTFESLNLHNSVLKAIAETGYTKPTDIQAQAIPVIMEGHDLMASSQTGSGKTAAFILPALNRLATPAKVSGKGPRVLVLTPTRELAQQVCNAATSYGKHMRVKTVSILGGMPYPVQNRLLSAPVDILVATPGRLIDHLERGRIDFSRLEVLILDEADRMLDMGFVDAVEQIADATPASRQTLLFSATLEGVVGNLASRLLKTPKTISVSAAKDKHESIEQRLMVADDVQHKNRLLNHIVTDVDVNQAIIFTATKRDADELADQLSAQGHSVAALHGDMSQRERNRTLQNLRKGSVRILVATDVAARGIDVKGISHVINFDLPRFAEDYVHRIGRTGRGGQTGIAISFASNRDVQLLKKIERYTEQSIKLHTIDGLEPKFALRKQSSSSGAPRRSGGGNGGGFRGDRNANSNGGSSFNSNRPSRFGANRGESGFGGGNRGGEAGSTGARNEGGWQARGNATLGGANTGNRENTGWQNREGRTAAPANRESTGWQNRDSRGGSRDNNGGPARSGWQGADRNHDNRSGGARRPSNPGTAGRSHHNNDR